MRIMSFLKKCRLCKHCGIGILAIVVSSCASSNYKTLSLEQSGFPTEARLYTKLVSSPKAFDIVFLHDKRGNPNRWHTSKFSKDLNAFGYQLIVPHMLWSEKHGYHGSRELALRLIDESVKLANNKNVVLVGHDLGAIMAVQYAAMNPSEKLKAIVLVAPAHDPNIDRKLYEATAKDAEKACAMVKHGKKIDRAVFADMNLGKTSFIEATAEYYCSFYSIEEFPDTMRLLGNIKVPTIIISAADDPSTQAYSHDAMFDALPVNANNKYMKLSGTHNNVLYRHVAEISAWIDGLPK